MKSTDFMQKSLIVKEICDVVFADIDFIDKDIMDRKFT